MANLDISRDPFGVAKHYTSARMQQGRSLLDADWNDDGQLRAENLRLNLLEILGVQGSSNAGFAVGGVEAKTVWAYDDKQWVESYDFSLHAGSFFVGGLRQQIEAGKETFLGQVDWQQIDRKADNLPTRPSFSEMLPEALTGENVRFGMVGLLEVAPRYDLVYLEAWEQPVTAVEDAELRERGLGGPDSAARIRRMRRILVAESVEDDAPESALAEVMAALEAEGVGSFDAEQGEFVSAAKLTVSVLSDSSDLCTPTPPGGYLGHEDQAIRVELRKPNAIIWGFDNAAPLYRVKVGAGGRRLTFLNPPRDGFLRPQQNQLVEVIAWGSALPNGEKAAELTGELRRVEEAYDPASGELLLDEALPQGMLDWLDANVEVEADESEGLSANLTASPLVGLSATAAAEAVKSAREALSAGANATASLSTLSAKLDARPGEDAPGRYLYLRLWDRGGDLESPNLIEMSEPVALGNTGLQLRLSGKGRAGDYWILAARRATPQQVVPWELLSDHAPMGPRRFYASLAMIRWEVPVRIMSKAERVALELELGEDEILALTITDAFEAVWGPLRSRVSDGRRSLAKLCVGGCCSITVGNGAESEGMVNTLSEALALVPDGGRICLLPGDHAAEVELVGRKKVTIVGCGEQSRLINATYADSGTDLYTQGTPLITLTDCDGIVLRDFSMRATSTVGIKLRNADDRCREITIEGLKIVAGGNGGTGSYAMSQAAVLALGVEGMEVRGCEVLVSEKLNITPALVLGGTGMRVHDNAVQAGDVEGSDVFSMGGIHILSHSVDVRVERNLIRGGWGHGVALGHLIVFEKGEMLSIDEPTAWSRMTRSLGDVISNLRGWAPAGESPTSLGEDDYWTPAGPVVDLHVCNNRIRGMGLSGVSTGGFIDHTGVAGARYIVAIDLEVGNNEIIGNVQTEDLPSTGFTNLHTAVGGVVLAAGLNVHIHGNSITDNYNTANSSGSAWVTPIAGVAVIAGQGLIIEGNQIADNGLAYEVANTILDVVGLRGGVVIHEVSAVRGYTFRDAPEGVTVISPSWTQRSNDHALIMRRNQVRHQVGKALWVLRGFGPMVISENSLQSLGDPTSTGLENSVVSYTGVGTFSSQGACVQISNFAYPLDALVTVIPNYPQAQMVDSDVSIRGGNVEFMGNHVRLEWEWLGGYCCSVLVSSFDSATVMNNVMSASMSNSLSGTEDGALLGELMTTATSYSYLFLNCWVGAGRLVKASGNRFDEGKYDCLFSCLARHAADLGGTSSAEELAYTAGDSLLVANAASHCMFPVDGDGAVNQKNAVAYSTVVDCDSSVSATEDNGVQYVKIF
ncbi:hypothetical protein G6O69_01130 [Pseudenhygromyxa sp. WMMC2535]|uniref:DUF6519 domain-containing protein n=1 Tax=Pseudenhygromyxa sp. WMMC2535 TaxID=2712867 RepID=UPI001552945F|nr:DUF6519 domain-containing protein [Pseudenhygromyxa sp. WMMC2535]NVB36414.1 hypothetical protein [Pseudenhygromyxa sp. WMMC2535]